MTSIRAIVMNVKRSNKDETAGISRFSQTASREALLTSLHQVRAEAQEGPIMRDTMTRRLATGPTAGPPAPVLRRLLSVREAAAFLGVTPDAVYRWVRARRLPCLRAGNRVRFSHAALLRWLGAEGEEG